MSNLLFVCSKNQWRSPTAERLFKNNNMHTARSAGTSSGARIKVSQKLLDWADVIFVMERKHRDLLNQRYQVNNEKLVVLDIDDNYGFSDPELINLLNIALKDYLT